MLRLTSGRLSISQMVSFLLGRSGAKNTSNVTICDIHLCDTSVIFTYLYIPLLLMSEVSGDEPEGVSILN